MTASSRDPFRAYRARLEALGFRPSSARGQNFLLDPSLHRWIADTAGPGANDVVLEIGVGLGFLTRELAGRAGSVLGVEIDKRLFGVAGKELAWSFFKERVETIKNQGGMGLIPHIVSFVTRSFASTAKADEIKAFFDANPIPSANRKVQQSLERAVPLVVSLQSGEEMKPPPRSPAAKLGIFLKEKGVKMNNPADVNVIFKDQVTWPRHVTGTRDTD